MTNNNMYFIANWKMYGNIADINKSKTVVSLSNLKKFKKTKIIYCPPYTLLKTFYEKVKNSNISIGAQNCHSNSEYGAFTGSVNAKLIKSSGAKFVILGHSENRKNGENDLIINKKIHSVLRESLNVIFCIGETLTEKKNKKTYSVLKKQITKGLKGIKRINNIFSIKDKYLDKNNISLPNWSIIELFKNYSEIKNFNKAEIYFSKINFSNLRFLMRIKLIFLYLLNKLKS